MREVGKRRQMRLQTDRGDLGINSDGQIVHRDLEDIVAHAARIVRVVGERLGIRQQQILPMRRLQRDPALQRSDIVPEVQRAGGSVARQDDRA